MYQSPLMEQVDLNCLPRHIAIIMDGNGRWAKKNFMPRVEGHRKGVQTVDRIVTLCADMHMEALTLYSFSGENWNRPRAEVNALMKILDLYLHKELERMKRENIRFNTIGRIDKLPPDIQKLILHAQDYTGGNDGLTLTLALSGDHGDGPVAFKARVVPPATVGLFVAPRQLALPRRLGHLRNVCVLRGEKEVVDFLQFG